MNYQWGAAPATPVLDPNDRYRDEAPQTLITAVRLMYAQVAMSVLSFVLLFVMKDDIRKAITDANPYAYKSNIDDAVNLALTLGVGIAVVFTVLYLVLVGQVRRSRSWARTTAIVLSVLGIVGMISSFLQTAPTTTRLVNVVELVLLVALLVNLRRSADYFRRNR